MRWLIAVLCVGMALSFFCKRCTDGFTLSRLDSVFPNDPRWDLPPLSGKEAEVFDQPFHYLGRGGQCFAFASEDGAYVIKFMNNHWRRPQQWWLSLPWPPALKKSFAKSFERIERKRARDFSSYKLAFEALKEESGLIAVHLNKTDYLHKTIQIIDKLQIAHLVDLDTTSFVLQKRAEKVAARMLQGDLAEARKMIAQILDLIVRRSEKGIFDEDAKIHSNIGLLQEEGGIRPIFIDIGRFKRDPIRQSPEVYQKDLEAITQRFRAWLELEHPSLLPALP